MSVENHPGSSELTWILCGASSIARHRVSCCSPPLATAYDGNTGEPKFPAILLTLIILPPRLCATIERAAICESRKQALRLVAITWSHSSAV
jgi:hypothetical protein